MTSIKCRQCGFVTSQTNTKCKRCGADLTAAANPRTGTASGRTKILMIGVAAGVIVVIAVLSLAILRPWVTVGESDSLPITMGALLNAHGRFKSPVNVRILSELHDQFTKSDFDQKRFLQNYPEVSVLEQLGLVSVENFKVIQADKYCWRYDFDYNRWSNYDPRMDRNPPVKNEEFSRISNPKGAHEECYDVWDYSVSIRLIDPDTIDRDHLSARLQYSNTSISPPLEPWSIHDQYVFMPPSHKGGFDEVTVPIGSFEVVEVSDVLPGSAKDTYSVGFKYRFKPNTLGEVFDRAIHHSDPAAIRKIIDQRDFDDRVRPLEQTSDGEGLASGYATLEKVEGRWRVTQIYFDNTAATKYTFHRL